MKFGIWILSFVGSSIFLKNVRSMDKGVDLGSKNLGATLPEASGRHNCNHESVCSVLQWDLDKI